MNLSLFFNRSLKLKSEPLEITADAGAVAVREILERSGVVERIAARIKDPRQPGKITHSMQECLRTLFVLAAQGRPDHNDADAYRNDPAFALAVCDRKGTAAADHSLPSQPTLSRIVALLSSEENRKILREELARFVKWRFRAIGGGRLHRRLTVDVDGLPIDVHGKQPGGAWNGYYNRKVYQPIVASVGDTGDMLDARLRNGQVHAADGALGFIADVVERVRGELAEEIDVRLDAGFPSEGLLAGLEAKGTGYVCRIRNNSVLKDLAEDVTDGFMALGPSKDGAPREMVFEERYQAGSWSRPRRLLQVVVERVGELLPSVFNLVTSIKEEEMSGREVLELYRRRGKAEAHMGELVNEVRPALSSSPRPKRRYRGRKVEAGESVDAFACNDVRLLISTMGYQIVHALRTLMEKATGVGWSLKRLLDRALRTAARFTVSGRRITMTASEASSHWWTLTQRLRRLPEPVF